MHPYYVITILLYFVDVLQANIMLIIMLEMDLIKLFNSIKKLPYILNFKRVQIELRVHKNVLNKFPNYKKNPFHSRIFHILTPKDYLK